MSAPTREAVFAAMQAKGYVTFAGDYDVNIIGIRTLPGAPNVFDDWMCVAYRADNAWHWETWPCTTDPGTYWLLNPSHVSGTAVLAPAQNRGAFTFGLHHGEYECLVQRGPVAAYLDANRDGKADETGPVHQLSAGCGIHIHRASETHTSTQVEKYSAGCQVFANPVHFAQFLVLCHEQLRHGHGDSFTYTLLEM